MTQQVNRSTSSPSTIALFDVLCDAPTPADKDEAFSLAAELLLGNYFPACLENGKAMEGGTGVTDSERPLWDTANKGAKHMVQSAFGIAKKNGRIYATKNNRIRMKTSLARQWSVEKEMDSLPGPKEPLGVQEFGDVTYYAGIPEWEGWSWAPLYPKDVAHVRMVHPFPLNTIRKSFPGWDITESPDGLITFSAPVGSPVKQVVSEWLTSRGIICDGVRSSSNVKRRNLRDLHPDFLEAVVMNSLPLAYGLIAKEHKASMEVLTGSDADTNAWVRLWVVELVSTFNAQLGRPFGTWVRSKLKYQVQDLNRRISGRTASDAERELAKAQVVVEQGTGAKASNKDLADTLGITVGELSEKQAFVGRLRSLRVPKTLDVGPDAPEIPVIDPTANPEQEALSRERGQRITLAVLNACGHVQPFNQKPTLDYPLAFLSVYLMQWGDWVKTDLQTLAGCSAGKMKEQLGTVHKALRSDLSDLSQGSPPK